MYAKGKGAVVPSDAQAREKLALYVYEYLLHVGAQKAAQTFLSEIRWEKNITLGEPPGFLHSWWCVFWDLYCAAPERRETCEHSSEAKAFHDYTAAAAASPVLGNLPPGDGIPPGFYQGPPGSQHSPHPQPPPGPGMMGPHAQAFMSPRFPGGPRGPHRMPGQGMGGMPGPQPLMPSTMDPTRQPGHAGMGPIQRMTPPRGMAPMGPQAEPWFPMQSYGGGVRPPHTPLGGPAMPGVSMGPGGGRPWPNASNPNSGAPGSGGPPGTPIMPSPGGSPGGPHPAQVLAGHRLSQDSTGSNENMYTMMTPVPPGANRPNFPMGPGDGGMGMESHMNGSLGSADMDGIAKVRARARLQNSPNNMSGGMSNAPGTPHEDDEIPGGFLNPFPGDSFSPGMPMGV
ncbi:single-stranded DNA-binding protein 2-like isoform X4 [Lethenteron reissneri]|uniref:single-stranded DNA-binding protein 2-like isoform X4 n=1 Tax=Lethenteron reissneri TaxID=7753 RepID=UPI002AB6AE59|nr:single-stranded DNA-binding protein 2-like isoform X4 [Lethenteron reissneri]